MNIPREIEIQTQVEDLLVSRNLFPNLVFYTFGTNYSNSNGVLSISFFTNQDLKELLDLLDYNSLCDKSGYIIIEEYNTVILIDGHSILDLWTKL